MSTLYIVLGIIVIIGTIYFLIKRVEARMVLFASGLLMCILAGQPMAAFDAFASRMTAAGLIQAILSVMGFAFVMKYTECDKHMVHLIGGGLKKVGGFLIPTAVILTFLINIALPSAAGTAAAVGAIFIPILMAAGVHPATAAAAVFAGTFGSMLNPGNAHNPFVGELAGIESMDVISVHSVATISSGIIAAIVLFIVAIVTKEHKGYVPDTMENAEAFGKVNLLYAIVPILPVVLLVLGSTVVPALEMGVPHAMLIGALIALIVTRKSPTKLTQEFFNGMGKAYANVMGIIITASVFVAGMNAVGLIDAFINAMTNSPAIVNICAAFGPFLLAVVCGSGDAATFAFNEAVTPFAEQFGVPIANMGAMAALGGALGRSMSPIAGAAIVCAGIANVNPMELAKRNAPGMIIATIVSMIILL